MTYPFWNPQLSRSQVAGTAVGLLLGCGFLLYRYITAPVRHPDSHWSNRTFVIYKNTSVGSVFVLHRPLRPSKSVYAPDWTPYKSRQVFLPLPAQRPKTPEAVEREKKVQAAEAARQQDTDLVIAILKAKGVRFAPPEDPEVPPDPKNRPINIAIEIGGQENTEIAGKPDWGMLSYKVTFHSAIETSDGWVPISYEDPNSLLKGKAVEVCSPANFEARRTALLRRLAEEFSDNWHKENPS